MKNINAILAGDRIPPKNALWLDGSTAKYFKRGKWISIGSNSDITDSIIKLENGQGFINISSATESKTVLELLNKVDSAKPFYINIGDGFGTATWNPTSGGKAFITGADGHAKSYTISKDGVITLGKDIDLANPDTDLFVIVSKLPEENIKTGKLYCIKNTASKDSDNTYTEYAYINNAWEKMGEFKADPDLSGYAKLNGNGQTIAATYLKECRLYDGQWYLTPTANNLKSSTKYFATDGTIQSLEKYARVDVINRFTQDVYIDPSKSLNGAKLLHCLVSGNGKEPYLKNNDKPDANYVYNCAGGLTNINEGETFTFTLDDGSTVEKKIRVIN